MEWMNHNDREEPGLVGPDPAEEGGERGEREPESESRLSRAQFERLMLFLFPERRAEFERVWQSPEWSAHWANATPSGSLESTGREPEPDEAV
jgi:hypothetical protein